MYFVGILIFIVFLVVLALFTGSPASFIDIPSILVILGISLPMLMASGLFSDFLRGIRIMGQKTNTYSAIELKKSETAVSLMIKLVLLSGIFGSTVGTIALLSQLNDAGKIGQHFAIALITLFYSLFILFILLPIQAKIKAILLTLD